MINYEITILLAICATVWVHVLVSSEGIFSFIPVYCKKAFGANKISFVLFECSKCNAAWWAIACILFARYKDPLEILLTIMFTIFVAYVIDLVITRIKTVDF